MRREVKHLWQAKWPQTNHCCPFLSDWLEEGWYFPNCYQQPHMHATAFQRGIPTGWRKESNQKPFCLSAITLQSEQMTSAEMDFIRRVVWEPRASQLGSNPALRENITAHFTITSQDLDSVMWKYGGRGKWECIHNVPVRQTVMSLTSFRVPQKWSQEIIWSERHRSVT